jgi:DNA-binding HxlR family transcriptional regulator
MAEMACAVESAVRVIGGKWKSGILFRLAEGAQRPSGLLRQMPWISEKVLQRQLRELEAEGIVTRRTIRASPPHVEYTLTPHGETLRPLLAAIGTWGAQHRDRAE